ncbi:MAG: hypothetical protein AAF337_09145 [Pseudomonadota bacterium]
MRRAALMIAFGMSMGSGHVGMAQEPADVSGDFLWAMPDQTTKPALPPEMLKVGTTSDAAHLQIEQAQEDWSNDLQISYSLFDNQIRSIDLDFSVGLKPKRLMSFEAKW